MRYPENIPKEQLTVHSSDEMLLFTMVLALIIGIVLAWLGIKGKQMWLLFWSVGLVLISVTTFIVIWFNWI